MTARGDEHQENENQEDDSFSSQNYEDIDLMEDSKFPLFKIPFIIDLHRIAHNPECKTILADENLELDEAQKLDVKVIARWVRRQLEPALLYLLFLDKDNYSEYTRGWIASKLLFPQSLYQPYRIKKKVITIIDSILFDRSSKPINFDQDQAMSKNLARDAQRCITALSKKLADRTSFFSTERYTSCDAIIYCYLNRILVGEWRDYGLKNHLKQCDNLISFMKKFSVKNHLPNTAEGESTDNANKRNSKSDLWSQMFGPAVIAIAINLIYAFRLGLIDSESHSDEFI